MVYHFAWVDSTETTFGPEHEVEDLEVFTFKRVLQEGEFARLVVEVVNPKTGLLAPGRKQWLWFSYDHGTGAVPLFFGRLHALPRDLAGETVTLEFVARPGDWAARRRAAADPLKVRPFWAPEWLDEGRREDPDAVLEAYAAKWHADPVTHAVTASSIVAGEDGTVDLAGLIFRDGFDVQWHTVPLRRVDVDAEVHWEQAAIGTVDFTDRITRKSARLGGGYPFLVATYTGQGLQSDWPEIGAPIGAGWSVGASSAERVDGGVLKQTVDIDSGQIVREGDMSIALADGSVVHVPLWLLKIEFVVRYETRRSRTERMTFSVESDVQAVIAEPGDEETETISVSTSALSEPIDPATTEYPDGAPPLDDVRRRSYFLTERGHQSAEYLMMLARVRLIAAARAAEVNCETDFDTGLSLTCRKSARVVHDLCPGGEATGKIISVTLRDEGEGGRKLCEVAIAPTVGRGASVAIVAGNPVYVEDGYVEDGYQARTGATVAAVAGELTYTTYDTTEPDDDGVNFIAGLRPPDVIEDLTIKGHYTAQRRAMTDPEWAIENKPDGVSGEVTYVEGFFFGVDWADPQSLLTALNWHHTNICLTLVPFAGGPFETDFPVTMSDLMVPKGIDLEAAT